MSIRWNRWAGPTVVLLALASSAIGIVNWFTYDDRYIVELNPATRNLHAWWRAFQTSYWPKDWGGDGYRPLTILAFKIEGVIGGGIPIVHHAVNIIFYAAVSLLVFALARRVLPVWAAWVAAALFAVHPVHVEAVANVVGQAELIVAVALLSATVLYIRDRQAGALRTRTALGIIALYTVACFSKEHGIVLPAILAAAELTVIRDTTRRRDRVRPLRPFYLGLVLVALAFMAVRSLVLTDHGIGGFQPFTPFYTLHISNRDRVLTALGVVPQWARLLYWPAHLSSEYGPPQIEIAQGPSVSQLPGFMLLIATVGLGVALRRRQPVMSFGVAFACITLLPSSNFLLPAGIVLAERTLFLPSVGAMLIVGGAAAWVVESVRLRHRDERRLVLSAQMLLAILVALGVARSALRTRVWKDNETLFRQAIVDSPRAYRAHYMLGAWEFEHLRKREGEAEYRKALNLFPYDPYLSYHMAEQYRNAGLCGPAIPLYRWTHGLDPDFPVGHSALAYCLLNEGQYDEAKVMAMDAIRSGGDVKVLHRVMFLADSAKAAGAPRKAATPFSASGGASKLPDSVQKTGSRTPIRPTV
ncbi:MAG: tetratricopeptide repeat protein [bacterium]